MTLLLSAALGGPTAWTQMRLLLLFSSETLNKTCHVSEPQFSHLPKGRMAVVAAQMHMQNCLIFDKMAERRKDMVAL